MNNEQNIETEEVERSARFNQASKEFAEFLLHEKEKREQELRVRQKKYRDRAKRKIEQGIPFYALDHCIEERNNEISWDGIFDAYRESCDDWDTTQDIKGMFGNIFA